MSRMMKFYGKPPLAKSPIRLPNRRSLRSDSSSQETPLACYAKTTQGPSRYWDKEDDEEEGEEKITTDLPPEYKSISSELLALANMVKQEFSDDNNNNNGVTYKTTTTSPLFERGRFYDLYSARRNERLKRKQIETRCSYDDYLRVNVETSKRLRDSNKFQSGRKSMSSVICSSSVLADRSAHPRYSLRSSLKENQKPPLAAKFDKAVAAAVECDRKIGARRARKI